MTFIKVDLPLPFGPSIATCSPVSIEKERPRSAIVFSRCTETFSNSIRGIDMVGIRIEDRITIVTIERPQARNAVDRDTAEALAYAFRQFDADPLTDVAILTGKGGNFCAGADLKAFNNHLSAEGDGPMGPTRMRLSKPVIAAVEG